MNADFYKLVRTLESLTEETPEPKKLDNGKSVLKESNILEMDKSQPSSDRGGESSGDPYAKGGKATPVKSKDMSKHALKILGKAMDKARKKPDRYHIVGKDGKPANLASYADRASAIKDRDEKHPGAVVQQVGPRGKVKGVSEGSLNEGQYEMMMRNGQVKKFIAKDDADAKRIAAGHGAKSVIRLKGGVPAGKVSEQGVAEGTAVPWQDVINALASGYPDLDPTDSLAPIMRKYGVDFDDLNLLARRNGYNDIYAVLDEFGQDQGVAEGSTNDYFKRRKDEEDRIAGTKLPAKRTPTQTDYAKRRAQEKKVEQGVAEVKSGNSGLLELWKNYGKAFNLLDYYTNASGNRKQIQKYKQIIDQLESRCEAEFGSKVCAAMKNHTDAMAYSWYGQSNRSGELHAAKLRKEFGINWSGHLELYGLKIGDTVKTEINGVRVQGDVIDIFPDKMEVELLLRGPNAGKTVTVDVRDTEALSEQGEAEGQLKEVAPPGAKAERMVKHIKAGYAKDGKLSDKEKSIAYATAWKAHNKGKVEEGEVWRPGMPLAPNPDMGSSLTPREQRKVVTPQGPEGVQQPYLPEPKKPAAQPKKTSELSIDTDVAETKDKSKIRKSDRFSVYQESVRYKTINRLIKEEFNSDDNISLEEKDIKSALGDNLFNELQAVKNNESEMSEQLKDALFTFYKNAGELPPEVSRNDQDITEYIKDRIMSMSGDQSDDRLSVSEDMKVKGTRYGGSAQTDDQDDDDETGEKKSSPAQAEKRGRGRPRKDSGDANTQAKYSGAKDLQSFMVGNVPKKSKSLEKLPTTKYKIKG